MYSKMFLYRVSYLLLSGASAYQGWIAVMLSKILEIKFPSEIRRCP